MNNHFCLVLGVSLFVFVAPSVDSAEASTRFEDCNSNGIDDAEDILSGYSQDCNKDLIPDECIVCPPIDTIDLVFIMDNSDSMRDEMSALCGALDEIINDLLDAGMIVNSEVLRIHARKSSNQADNIDSGDAGEWKGSCTEDSVVNRYGNSIPGMPEVVSYCLGQGGGQGSMEDWGPATAVVAVNREWTPGAVRIIVPISDEGPRCGTPILNPGPDYDVIEHAIPFVASSNVIVSPIVGTPGDPLVFELAQWLAEGGRDGGQAFISTDPGFDLAQHIIDIVAIACTESADCNENGQLDECDIADGISNDCQGNLIPDECEADCNSNGIADECDIEFLLSTDCQSNGIPDECEQDCNTNGIDDSCEIMFVVDCQPNGIPDECEQDCDFSGVADECEILEGLHRDCQPNGFPDSCDIEVGTSEDCNADGIPDECSGDCNNNQQWDACDIHFGISQDCGPNGIPDECQPDCNLNGQADDCDILDAYSFDCNGNGIPDECDISQGTSLDTNQDGSPDECTFLKWTQPPITRYIVDQPPVLLGWDEQSIYSEHQVLADDWLCVDGRPVQLIQWWGSYQNGWLEVDPPVLGPEAFHLAIWSNVPDSGPGGFSHPGELLAEWVVQMEQSGELFVAVEYHPNSQPGSCFRYTFQIPPGEEFSQDPQTSGVYWLSISAQYPEQTVVNCPCWGDVDGDQMINVVDSVLVSTHLGCYVGQGDPLCDASDVNCDGEVKPDDRSIVLCQQDSWPPNPECCGVVQYPWGWTTRADISGNSAIRIFDPVSPNGIDAQFYLDGEPLLWLGDPWDLTFSIHSQQQLQPRACCLAEEACLDVFPWECIETYEGELMLEGANCYMTPCDPDLDCNSNGQADYLDLVLNVSQDCQTNGIPDECETDCNSSGKPDDCDILDGTSLDCQPNGIPDDCEHDCNSNGQSDDCDIRDAISADCQSNGIPDECDISDETSDDCQPNTVPDECDIASGTSTDANTNGIPDECEPDCAIESLFTSGIEGWSPVNSSEVSIWHESTGGNPGGYMRTRDVSTGSAVIKAPAHFLGDWRLWERVGVLSFDGRHIDDPDHHPLVGIPRIMLIGPEGSLTWHADSIVTTTWVNYQAPLDETKWNVVEGCWEAVLADVTEVRLLVDWTTGRDQNGIDNVRLDMRGDLDEDCDIDIDDLPGFIECLNGPGAVPDPTPPLQSDECLYHFDYDRDLDVDLEDYSVFMWAAGGRPVGGACCLPFGSCMDNVTESTCLGCYGSWYGEESMCDSISCPQPQACCYPEGICEQIQPDDCLIAGGTPQGEGTNCDSTYCPHPDQACCFYSGNCQDLEPLECANQEGSPQGVDSTCSSVSCPQPQACCLPDGSCEDLHEDDCGTAGGTAQGETTDCSTTDCPQPPEACCFIDGHCEDLEPEACTNGGGESLGYGTDCLLDECPQPVACCYEDGTCEDLPENFCIGSGGFPEEPGSDCIQTYCPQPPQACCYQDGLCEDMEPMDCSSNGGVPQGLDSECLLTECPQPEACCFDDGSCQDILPDICSGQGGVSQGPGSDCLTAECLSGLTIDEVWSLSEHAGLNELGIQIIPARKVEPRSARIEILEVTFSEAMDPLFCEDPANLVIEDGDENPVTVSALLTLSTQTVLRIELATPLDDTICYLIDVSGMRSASGKRIDNPVFALVGLIGDVDADLVVDQYDLIAVNEHHKQIPSEANDTVRYDINQDGIINAIDSTMVTTSFGKTASDCSP